MSEDQGTTTTESAAGAEAGAPPAEQVDAGKTFTQADLDRVVEQRLTRERQKFADYDQVKADAAELAKIRDGEKTDLQLLQEQLATEREAHGKTQTELSVTKRTQYGVDKGLPQALAKKLTSPLDDTEALEAEIAELAQYAAPAAKPEKRTPGSFQSGATGKPAGGTGKTLQTEAAEAVRALLKNR